MRTMGLQVCVHGDNRQARWPSSKGQSQRGAWRHLRVSQRQKMAMVLQTMVFPVQCGQVHSVAHKATVFPKDHQVWHLGCLTHQGRQLSLILQTPSWPYLPFRKTENALLKTGLAESPQPHEAREAARGLPGGRACHCSVFLGPATFLRCSPNSLSCLEIWPRKWHVCTPDTSLFFFLICHLTSFQVCRWAVGNPFTLLCSQPAELFILQSGNRPH